MYYVIELTCIGPKIKEVFKSKELAVQYTIALHKNYPDKRYQIAKAELDIQTASSRLNRGATVQRTYLLTI